MIKKSCISFVLATTLVGLTGCTANNDNNNALDNNRRNMGVNVRNDTNNGVNVRNAANHNLRISNNAGRRVENLKEVDLAHVVVRNNDAYVAIKLNNRHRNNQANTGTTTNTGNNLGTTGGTGTSNAQGANMGQTGPANNDTTGGGGTGTNNNTGINRTRGTGNNSNLGITGNNITGNTGTRDTGINGGNTFNNDTNFDRTSSQLDKKIAKQVRKAENGVNNVYVSYDPTFFNKMTNYSNDIATGRNRDGVWNDISNTVNRIFR